MWAVMEEMNWAVNRSPMYLRKEIQLWEKSST